MNWAIGSQRYNSEAHWCVFNSFLTTMMAQRKKIYQAWTHRIVVNRSINSWFWSFFWDVWNVANLPHSFSTKLNFWCRWLLVNGNFEKCKSLLVLVFSWDLLTVRKIQYHQRCPLRDRKKNGRSAEVKGQERSRENSSSKVGVKEWEK